MNVTYFRQNLAKLVKLTKQPVIFQTTDNQDQTTYIRNQ